MLGLAGESNDKGARVEAHYMRGMANEKLGDLRAAIADFSETLRLEPTHVKAILARGACYNLASDYEAACGAHAPCRCVLQAASDMPGTAAAQHRCGASAKQTGSHTALLPAHFGTADQACWVPVSPMV